MSVKKVMWLSLALVTLILLAACVQPPPAAQPAEVAPAVEEEAAPARAIKIRVAYPSTVDFEDLPSLIAHEILADQGYAVLPTFYAQPELAVEAMARGDAEFGNGAERTFWAGAARGAPIKTIMEQAANSWAIYSIPEIQECADLDGQRFAQHSEGAVSKAMSDAYLLENCPDINPEIMIIPGSENRAAALLAGEIDATPVELADAVQIDEQAPGQYHVLTNFAKSVPRLKTTGIYVNTSFAEEHPEVVKDYIRAVLTVHRQIQENPDLLIAEAKKWLPIEEDLLPKIAQAHFDAGIWDVNGGMTEEAVDFSVNFFVNTGSLPEGLTVEQVADLSYLEEVLDETGRQ